MKVEEIAMQKTKELLDQLGTEYSDVSVNYEESEKNLNILIKGDNVGMLIGLHGKNLLSLKTILSLIINKEFDHDNAVRVLLNINDYSEKREEQLKSMLEKAKSIMESKGKTSYSMPPMNAADRRMIHTLAEQMALKTTSEGEGRDRHVVISIGEL
jgi:spoIIIJ-associated protein